MDYPKRLGLNVNYPSMNIYELTRQQQKDSEEKRNKTKILQIEIFKKPKNFSDTLEFKIKTDLPSNETVSFAIMDSDSIWSDKPSKEDPALVSNKSLRLGSAKYTTPFTEDMQKKAFKDTEFDTAECYIKVFHPKVGTVYSEVFLVEKYEFKKTSNSKDECTKEAVLPLKLTEEEKAKFIATVLVETGGGDQPLWDIAWIYFNLIHDLGFEKGLKRSSAYYLHDFMYKVNLFYLGYGEKYKNDVGTKKWNKDLTVKTCSESASFKNGFNKIAKFKDFVEKNILSLNPKTCYKGWFGQGYWRDMNINDGRYERVWEKARQYYWLQKQGKVQKKLVKELLDGKITTYLYDSDGIKKYFDLNPQNLPKLAEEIPLLDFD